MGFLQQEHWSGLPFPPPVEHILSDIKLKRSNQSILKEINSEYSLKGLMLKLQYFVHLMWRANSLTKTLMLGKTEGRRRRGQQRMRCLDDITDSMDMNLSKLWEIVKVRVAWHAAVHGATMSWMWLSDWTATTHSIMSLTLFFNWPMCLGVVTCQQIHTYFTITSRHRTSYSLYSSTFIHLSSALLMDRGHYPLLLLATRQQTNGVSVLACPCLCEFAR